MPTASTERLFPTGAGQAQPGDDWEQGRLLVPALGYPHLRVYASHFDLLRVARGEALR